MNLVPYSYPGGRYIESNGYQKIIRGEGSEYQGGTPLHHRFPSRQQHQQLRQRGLADPRAPVKIRAEPEDDIFDCWQKAVTGQAGKCRLVWPLPHGRRCHGDRGGRFSGECQENSVDERFHVPLSSQYSFLPFDMSLVVISNFQNICSSYLFIQL